MRARLWGLAFAMLLSCGAVAAPFTPPPESAIPAGPFGDSVRRGKAIFTDTQKYAHGYVGNALRCANCHLDAGRQPGAAPMWAAWPLYPQFRTKNGKVNSMALRIQECFRYSMNGRMPPDDSPLLTDLQSYFFWLAKGAPTGEKLAGQGYPALPHPPRPPDPQRGAAAFAKTCAAAAMPRRRSHPCGGRGPSTRAQACTSWKSPPASSTPTCRSARAAP
jgi:thiosulfate dehydrogenase